MSGFGVASAVLSQKAADLIGKYLVGFTRTGKAAAAGLYELADYVQREQETAVSEAEETINQVVQQEQVQHTPVTIC